MTKPMIIIAETDPAIGHQIESLISSTYNIFIVTDEASLIDSIKTQEMKIRVILMNEHFSNKTNDLFLPQIKDISILPEVIIYSTENNFDKAISAVKNGAYDYLYYPFTKETLLLSLEKVLNNVNFFQKVDTLKQDDAPLEKNIDTCLRLSKDLIYGRLATKAELNINELLILFPSINQNSQLATPLNLSEFTLFPTHKPKILIIEDDPILGETLEEFLNQDYTPILVNSGLKGFKIIQTNPDIDIILLDIYLPDINGKQLLNKINKLDHKCLTIVLSAYKESSLAIELLHSGAKDYLIKPCTEAVIKHTITNTLKNTYFNNALPLIKKKILETGLSKTDKVAILNDIKEDRLSSNKLIYMEDLYHFFPELKDLQFPLSFPIPNHILEENTLSLFIDDLFQQLSKLKPMEDKS